LLACLLACLLAVLGFHNLITFDYINPGHIRCHLALAL
jgi:hypothetical protein